MDKRRWIHTYSTGIRTEITVTISYCAYFLFNFSHPFGFSVSKVQVFLYRKLLCKIGGFKEYNESCKDMQSDFHLVIILQQRKFKSVKIYVGDFQICFFLIPFLTGIYSKLLLSNFLISLNWILIYNIKIYFFTDSVYLHLINFFKQKLCILLSSR